ncbi:MAG: ATP-dependent zinc metalloprotease FtsH [Puniceicoccales bacterium]|jgi:cell division protease FtsH|nr:ATP-dependent zinc metalloprotease FtsH [Puniceicoccales bacterium]
MKNFLHGKQKCAEDRVHTPRSFAFIAMRKKNSGPARFQPKVLVIWGILIFSIILAWTMISPAKPAMQREEWTIGQVLEAAQKGLLRSGEIQAIPSRGLQWYRISGKTNGSDGSGNRPVNFTAQGRLTDGRFNDIMASVKFKEKPGNSFFTDLMLGIIPFLVIFTVLYFFLFRQIRSTGRSAMSFGKSRARLQIVGEKKVTFADVAGCDEAKEEVAEIVDFLKNPKKYNDIGGRIPKGCLMVGPPGTGKTLLAKAVSGEAGVPFFSISGSDFVEMFVGVGAARVRDLFEQGRKNAPCIIFIDEIDAVGRQRGAGLGGGNDEREQTLNSILVEMDGFDGREGVILMAATNRPDILDSALLRPGRFDRQVIIDLPDLYGRQEILQIHGKKVKLAKCVDLSVFAKNTPGFSGADLENLINEGALLAARCDKKEVQRLDLESAREKVCYGRERKRLLDDQDKRITAYHEAGHAIVQASVDDGLLPVHKVTIIPRGRSLGSTMFMPSKDILNKTKQSALNEICCAMGGRIAEDLTFSEISSGASSDIKQATKLARRMVCDWGMSSLGTIAFGENQDHIFLGRDITRNQNYSERTAQLIDSEVESIIRGEYKRANGILENHRSELEIVAAALLEHETIDGVHVYEVLKHGRIISPVPYVKVLPTVGDKEFEPLSTAGAVESNSREQLTPMP